MADATVGSHYSTAQGPIRVEYIYLSTVASTNNFYTKMSRPIGAVASTDGTGGATVAPTVSFSGKTGTITQTSLSGGKAWIVVWGF